MRYTNKRHRLLYCTCPSCRADCSISACEWTQPPPAEPMLPPPRWMVASTTGNSLFLVAVLMHTIHSYLRPLLAVAYSGFINGFFKAKPDSGLRVQLVPSHQLGVWGVRGRDSVARRFSCLRVTPLGAVIWPMRGSNTPHHPPPQHTMVVSSVALIRLAEVAYIASSDMLKLNSWLSLCIHWWLVSVVDARGHGSASWLLTV